MLVVDDDPGIRVLLRDVLELLGCEVQTAADGHEALANIRQYRPDLVLLDLMMPGMDGRTCGTRMRAEPWGAHVPIALMSAAPAEAQKVCHEIRAQACMPKPFDLDQLARLVEQVRDVHGH